MLNLLILTSLILSSLAYHSTLYTYKTVHNIPMQAIVILPDTPPPPQKYPVLYALHGGGFLTGYYLFIFDKTELNEALRRGWAIVSIDYRLSPAALLPDIMQDVHDGYRWLRKDLARTVAINPNHIVLWGGSSGGTLAAIAASQLIPRPKAVALIYPFCLNFKDLWSYDPSTPVSEELAAQAESVREPMTQYFIPEGATSDPRDRLFQLTVWGKKFGWLYMTHDPKEDPQKLVEMLKEYSAVDNIDENYPPTFMIHGLSDWVPCSQSFQMAQALEKKNIEHKIGFVPKASHVFEGELMNEVMWDQYFDPLFDFIEDHITKPEKVVKDGRVLQGISLFAFVLVFIVC